jgi:type I restriction enzyme S subunit
MLQNKERYRALGIGSTFLEVNKRDTERFEVLVPPDYNNQQRIAEILSTVDEAIEQTEALIAKTQQIKVGLMHDLFTRGVTADGQLRPPREEAPRLYKESPLGWIPKEWEPTSLKEEVGISHGFAFSGDGFFDAPPGAVLLTPGNFYRDGGLYFTPNNTKYFRGDIPEATVLSPGEMVTVMTDLSPQTLILGRFAVIDTGHPVLHNQRIGLVRIKEPKRWEKQFLATALNQDRIRREIIVGATGTTVRHTSPDRILSVHFARPPMDEQRKCAEIVASVDARLAAEDSTREKLERTKRGLMSDLLTGRVRVSTQDPSEPKEVAANV